MGHPHAVRFSCVVSQRLERKSDEGEAKALEGMGMYPWIIHFCISDSTLRKPV